MYHSWGSQNAWLRQIHGAQPALHEPRRARAQLGIADGDWVWITSRIGRVKAQVKLMDGVNADTVWTWNAIGKRAGAWGLDADAPEATRGFLLNHLIAELLPERDGGYRYSNSDPVTGQAAWYDLRVRIEKAGAARGRARPRRASSRCAAAGSARGAMRTEAERDDRAARRTPAKKLGLVIDLDTCVGCQACATSCKEWNTGGYSAPLTDQDALRRRSARRLAQPRARLRGGRRRGEPHRAFPALLPALREPACVTVCPTGASYKRAEDGIVLVDPDTCIGCKLCSWACPYGAREYDYDDGVMKKCTLCVDRIYNETSARGGPHPGLRARLPDRRAAFRRSRRSRQRGVAAGRRARRLRPAAGDRLQAGQQVSAAARRAATTAPRRRRRRARATGGGSGSLADRFFAWVDGRCRAELDARCIPPIRSSSSPRPRAPATAC